MKNKERKYFKALTTKGIKEAISKQDSKNIWNFYDEREFVENIISQRFNYLLLVYSLFITAFAAINGKESKLIILGTGIFFLILISFTIYRAYIRLDINLRILHSLDEFHVFPMLRKETKSKKFRLFNAQPLIGFIIPIYCILSMILAFLLISFDIWVVELVVK